MADANAALCGAAAVLLVRARRRVETLARRRRGIEELLESHATPRDDAAM